MDKDNMCRIPVRATMVINEDGKAVMTDAEWADIPADVIAKYIIDHWNGYIPGITKGAVEA